jgi:hypothetical protein
MDGNRRVRLLFVNKKKQKTLLTWAVVVSTSPAQSQKFCAAFLKSGCFLYMSASSTGGHFVELLETKLFGLLQWTLAFVEVDDGRIVMWTRQSAPVLWAQRHRISKVMDSKRKVAAAGLVVAKS